MPDPSLDNRCRDLSGAINGLRQRPGDQPLPTEGQENVQDALIGEIEKRKVLGLQRYGRPVQTFNGRNAVRDLLDELLDGATYAMQIQMEIDAVQNRINTALGLHAADGTGLCTSCKVSSPCSTRQTLTGQKVQAITVSRVDPVQEVACSPDAIDWVREHFSVDAPQPGLPNIGAYMGFPVYVDDELPPRTVRLQPKGRS
jgi:hypothetical protein